MNVRKWGGCRQAAIISPWLISNVANWVACRLSGSEHEDRKVNNGQIRTSVQSRIVQQSMRGQIIFSVRLCKEGRLLGRGNFSVLEVAVLAAIPA